MLCRRKSLCFVIIQQLCWSLPLITILLINHDDDGGDDAYDDGAVYNDDCGDKYVFLFLPDLFWISSGIFFDFLPEFWLISP